MCSYHNDMISLKVKYLITELYPTPTRLHQTNLKDIFKCHIFLIVFVYL